MRWKWSERSKFGSKMPGNSFKNPLRDMPSHIIPSDQEKHGETNVLWN
jgi:hypothetical protein